MDCENCEIRSAPFDTDAAEIVLKWFKSQGWLTEDEGMPDVIERKIYCSGCQGSRDTHWSADCWISACCVDQHGLENCSQCLDFACERLIEWSKQNQSYYDAHARLNQ